MSGMALMGSDGHTYRVECELIEVTSLRRPDTSWRYVDPAGHLHQWHSDGKPAEAYSHMRRYDVPTTIQVDDPSIFMDDGDGFIDEIGQSHLECAQCGAEIKPRTTADTTQCYVQGLKSYFIDDELVDEPTFMAAIEGLKAQ